MGMLRKLCSALGTERLARAILGNTAFGLTATGTNQATAYRLNDEVNVFTTVPNGCGFILPLNTNVDDEVTVVNDTAQVMPGYPPLGESINLEAVNAPVLLTFGSYVFRKVDLTKWRVTSSSSFSVSSSSEVTEFGLTGWTNTAGNGAVSITDKINLSILAASTAASLYPDTNNPKSQRSIASYVNDDSNFTVVARVANATLHADSRLSMAIGDASDASGMIVFLDSVGSLGLGPWDNSGDAGTATAACPLDGTGWIRIVCRGGLVSAGCGTGTTTTPPTAWHTIRPGRPTGSAPFAKLTMYMSKWAGADTSGAFDNVQITVL